MPVDFSFISRGAQQQAAQGGLTDRLLDGFSKGIGISQQFQQAQAQQLKMKEAEAQQYREQQVKDFASKNPDMMTEQAVNEITRIDPAKGAILSNTLSEVKNRQYKTVDEERAARAQGMQELEQSQKMIDTARVQARADEDQNMQRGHQLLVNAGNTATAALEEKEPREMLSSFMAGLSTLASNNIISTSDITKYREELSRVQPAQVASALKRIETQGLGSMNFLSIKERDKNIERLADKSNAPKIAKEFKSEFATKAEVAAVLGQVSASPMFKAFNEESKVSYAQTLTQNAKDITAIHNYLGSEVTMQDSLSQLNALASKHVNKGWFHDSFDAQGFNDDVANYTKQLRAKLATASEVSRPIIESGRVPKGPPVSPDRYVETRRRKDGVLLGKTKDGTIEVIK